MKKKYHAMVLSCMDPRFQPIIYNYLKKRKLNGKYSAFTIAGSAIGVTVSKFRKWHKSFWDNIDISIKLHKIKIILINFIVYKESFKIKKTMGLSFRVLNHTY